MEAWFRNGLEKRIIGKADHFVHREQADTVNQLILAFIEQD